MASPGPAVPAVLRGLEGVRPRLEDCYRDLHAHPELSHEEHRTAATVAQWLTGAGYETHSGVGGTGVVGVLRNGDGPTVLLRADLDALPVLERTGLPYASAETGTDPSGAQVPVMHACGHDVHVACLLGAAELLATAREQWTGTVVAVFQPAEEVGDGARGMVEDGLAELVPKPDVALAQHVLAFPAGEVGFCPGPFLSAANTLRITVHGRGAHGSMPQAAVDPVVLASMIVVRLQAVVAREVAPGEFAVLTVGSVQAGTAGNVIPDRAVIQLNVRAYSEATRRTVLGAIRRVVTAECQASSCPREPEFEELDAYPVTVNDPGVTERVGAAFTAFFGERAHPIPPQTASEDFSDLPNHFGIPYCYWGIGGIDPVAYHRAERAGRVAEDVPVNHAATFAPVLQPTLDVGTTAMVLAALAWLAKPDAVP